MGGGLQQTGFAPLPISVQAKLSARFAAVRPQAANSPSSAGRSGGR